MRVIARNSRRPLQARRRSRRRKCFLQTLLAALSVLLTLSLSDGAERIAPQPKVIAPDAYNFGHDAQEIERNYYGYLDLSANRGAVYFSTSANVTLGDLVAGASRSGASPDCMAQIIRNGSGGIHIPWSPGSKEALLPGDLVLFHGNRRQNAPGFEGAGRANDVQQADCVAVAFVGLLGRRPIVVSLVGSNATVPRVVDMLLQPPDVCQSVRVIRTNQTLGPLAPGETPERLVDGDVLVFDRSRMDAAALAHTQDTYQTEFPPAIELPDENKTEPLTDQHATREPSASLTGPAESGPAESGHTEFGRTESGHTEVIAGPQFAEAPALSSVTATVEPATEGVASDVSEDEAWDLTDLSPAAARTDAAAVVEPEFPILTSLVKPSDLDMQDLLEVSKSPTLETALHLTPAAPASEAAAIPQPIDAAPVAATPIAQETFGSFNAVTISASVLALAALCFGVSVLWTQIDRAAQDLQQPMESFSGQQEDAPTKRRILDRLIVNNVPLIEEQAQLPDRMDYHGAELGRRRLMLDQPHLDLMGPHFPVAAEATGGSPSRERVPSVASGFAKDIGGEQLPPEAEFLTRADGGESNDAAPDGKFIRSDAATLEAENGRGEQRQPHSKLLDRVLLAMEREKRR